MTHKHCETLQHPCGSREIFQSWAIALWEVQTNLLCHPRGSGDIFQSWAIALWEVQTNLLCHPWLQSSDTFFFLPCVLDFAEGTWYVPLITLLKAFIKKGFCFGSEKIRGSLHEGERQIKPKVQRRLEGRL